MTAPAVSTASAPAPSATSFEQDVGEFFGDFSGGGETPEPETSAAGTTPAEPATGTEDGAGTAEPKAGDDAADQLSEGPTPDAAAPVVEDDPFKDSTPASYVVNGQTVTTDDIRVFKEGGAVIRPESLPNVLSKLAERDQLSERVTISDSKYNTLAKATEWVDQSSGKTYTGPEAAIELRIGNASMFAENQLIVQAITDPDILARCLTTAMGADGKERVVFSESALNDLKREVALQQREIAATLRDHYKTVIAEASKPQPAPINYESIAPSLVKQIADASKLDASVLSPEDLKVLAEQLPFHTKDGLASVAWQNLAKRMMTAGAASKASAVSIASSTEKATKDAQARMAQAARGVKPLAPKPVAKPTVVSPQSERSQNEGDAFDSLLSSGAAAMRIAQ